MGAGFIGGMVDAYLEPHIQNKLLRKIVAYGSAIIAASIISVLIQRM